MQVLQFASSAKQRRGGTFAKEVGGKRLEEKAREKKKDSVREVEID